ncbi:MAG: DNA-binding protein [Azonexus sp.]
MARQGISEQQVIEAAEELTRDGQAATVSAVRGIIGSGSYSTIQGHLAKWKEGGANRPPADVPDMPEPVGKAARVLWSVAWKEAQHGVKGEREALDAARRDMERDRHDMTAEIARLETETTAQAEELARLREDLGEQAAALTKAGDSVNALQVENARLDERAKAAEGLGAELRQELGQLHSRFQELAARVTPAPASPPKSPKKPASPNPNPNPPPAAA